MPSFDIMCEPNAVEVKNAIEQANKEIANRFDFKGSDARIEQKELDRAKNQMKGSLMLSLESSHSRMSKLAKDELVYGMRTSLEDMLAHIDRVTTEQVYSVGRQLLDLDHLERVEGHRHGEPADDVDEVFAAEKAARQALRELEGSGITCPPANVELFETYRRYLQAVGFLPEPEALVRA